MSFSYASVETTEFGVCHGRLGAHQASTVPVDAEVQGMLRKIVDDTRESLGLHDKSTVLDCYEPSEEHSADRRLALPLTDPLAASLKAFYDVANWPVGGHTLVQPGDITAYFCLMCDSKGNKLLAIRRAAQFKAILKVRLIHLVDDSLKAFPDHVFKLDRDFDLLIVDKTVYINHVAAFEMLAEIEELIRGAAVENTTAIAQTLSFIDFERITDYVSTHKRAARLVAALHARTDLADTSSSKLENECLRSGVQVQTLNGKLAPAPGHELALLQMLDRRRYALSLIDGRWEQFAAGSRKSTGVVEKAQAAKL
jgi:hypothetical protein